MFRILNKIENILYFFLSVLDRPIQSEEKIIDSIPLHGVQIHTDKGWCPAPYFHLTKPLTLYQISTTHYELQGADTHLVFDENMNPIAICDLQIGQKIQTETGLEEVTNLFKTNYDVCMGDITVWNDTESYYTNHILSHNTTSSALFLLHYVLFNFDKNALVLGNKKKTSVEILDKIKKIFYEIPFFLRPGVLKWNDSEIVLDNGCRIMAEATTINSGISFTFHCVLADEFAHLAPNIQEPFYENLFPVITAGRAKFMITSTTHGRELFYRLFTSAEAGESEYAPFTTNWNEVPEWDPDNHTWVPRDEKWKRLQVANLGSEESFERQFGTAFDVNANTLIASRVINNNNRKSIVYVNKDMSINWSEYFFWYPDYDPEDFRKELGVITCDLAEGLGQDYTTFIFNVLCKTETGVKTKTVGYFHCREKSLKECAAILADFAEHYGNIDRTKISVEWNTYGELFVKYIQDIIDKQNLSNFDESMFIKYWNDEMTKFKYGIKLSHTSKLEGLTEFKNAYEHGIIENLESCFLNELSNFIDLNNNNSYSAAYGHDDIVMAQMHMAFVYNTIEWKEMVEILQSESGYAESAGDGFDIYGALGGSVQGQDIYSMMGGNVMGPNVYAGFNEPEMTTEARLRRF